MKIKPVKNYKKPNYAVKLASLALAAGVLTGCEPEEVTHSGATVINTKNNSETRITITPSEEVALEGKVVIEPDAESTEGAGEVELEEETMIESGEFGIDGEIMVSPEELELDGDVVVEPEVLEFMGDVAIAPDGE